MDSQAYQSDLRRISSYIKSVREGKVDDLRKYEKFADQIDKKWILRDEEYHARLMLVLCKPLSSGYFKDDRRYSLSRKYALSALNEPDKIPLILELELIGHVVTVTNPPRLVSEEKYAVLRREDVRARLHGWRRLLESFDPNWDPDEVIPAGNIAPPIATGLPAGVAPEEIQDPILRAEYQAAILRNRKQVDRYREQYELRKWLKRFPEHSENYIIHAYSTPPFNLVEAEQLLDEYLHDDETKTRILSAVSGAYEKTR